MSNTDPKKIKKILFREAKMCPNCATVLFFRMWPNPEDRIPTRSWNGAGGGLPHIRGEHRAIVVCLCVGLAVGLAVNLGMSFAFAGAL